MTNKSILLAITLLAITLLSIGNMIYSGDTAQSQQEIRSALDTDLCSNRTKLMRFVRSFFDSPEKQESMKEANKQFVEQHYRRQEGLAGYYGDRFARGNGFEFFRMCKEKPTQRGEADCLSLYRSWLRSMSKKDDDNSKFSNKKF